MKKTTLLFIFACITSAIFSQVRTYRQLPPDNSIGFELSNKYHVEVKACDSAYQDIHTYAIVPNDGGRVTQMEHLAMFGFDPAGGPATIKITLQNGTSLSSSNIELRNKTYQGVTISFADGAMYIEVCDPMKQLMVRMPGDVANPLMIHVDPYNDPAIPAGANVVVFDGGTDGMIHEQTAEYDRYTVPNNVDVVVIEDGALFKGTVHVESDRTTPLTVQGRGMIICRFVAKPANNVKMRYNAMELNRGNGHKIYGVTIVNARHFAIRTSDDAHLRNIKLYGYRANNDGTKTGANSTIENSFFKCNDDHVKLYADNIHVRNCVFYEQSNGAIFQFGWNNLDPGDNCLVENIEVLEWEANIGDPALGQGGIARSFINHREAESTGKMGKDNLFRNIYIQGPISGLVCLNGYQFEPITHENLVLENVTLEQATTKTSWLYASKGGGGTSIELNLKNVRYGNRFVAQSDFKTLGTVTINIDNTGTKYVGYMNPSDPADCQVCSVNNVFNDITDLTATANSCNRVVLNWTDNSTGESGYRIRRKISGEATFTTLGDVAANSETYTDNSVAENTAYIYQVRVLDNDAAAGASNQPSVLTLACGGGLFFIDHNSSGQRLKANASGGAVGVKAATATGNQVRWEEVDAGGGYFYLVHVASSRKLNATTNGDVINTVLATSTDNSAQWRSIDTGGGWFRLENRQFTEWLHLKPDGVTDFQLGPTTWIGNNTQWKFTSVPGALSAGGRIGNDTKEVSVAVPTGLKVYPNPAGNILNLANVSPGAQIEIYNMFGARILTGFGREIDVSMLNKGVYLIKSENSDVGKFIKE